MKVNVVDDVPMVVQHTFETLATQGMSNRSFTLPEGVACQVTPQNKVNIRESLCGTQNTAVI